MTQTSPYTRNHLLKINLGMPMRFFLFLCGTSAAVFFTTSAYSQIQSIIEVRKQELKSATGENRFNILNDLAWEYRFANPDTSIILANQALLLGEAIHIKQGLARSLNIIGVAKNYSGEKINAYDYYQTALEISKLYNDSIEIAYTYNNIGRVFLEQGLMDKAFSNITLASQIFLALNDPSGLAYCYQSLGYLFQTQRNYPKALENLQKALDLRLQLTDQRNIQSAFLLIGRLYAEQGLADKSLQHLLKADSIARSQQDEIQLAEIGIFLAKTYLTMGLVHKADSILTVSIKVIRKQNSVRILSTVLLTGAEVALAKGNISKAESFLNEALMNNKVNRNINSTLNIYFQLWKLNEKKGDRLSSLFYQNQYLIIRDTLNDNDIVRREEELNFAKSILISETENQRLRHLNETIEHRDRIQRILFILIAGFVAVSGVLIWLYLTKLKAIRLQLEKKNDLLVQINIERSSLISVVAHDLKSPLNKIQGLSNLIRMNLEFPANQAQYIQLMDRVILDGQSFIADLLSVHAFEEERIAEISEFDAADVVKYKTDSSCSVAINKGIELKRFLQPVRVKSDKEYLGRIVDNLVSNAIKFSPKQSEVILRLEKNRAHFLLTVEDKGPGFTEEDKTMMFRKFKKLSARPTDGESSTGLGLAIVKTLVEKLGGTIELDSVRGEGTKFIVSLPIVSK